MNDDPSFRPFLAQLVGSFVFDAIVDEIHVLPGSVIDPVVLYYRQFRSLIAIIEDMRGAEFSALPADRKSAIYSDYALMGAYALELADTALKAIGASLQSKKVD